jgi:hypothetical protein
LKDFGKSAFVYSDIESITIPSTVERLGYECLYFCKSLVSVIFEPGSKLRDIGKRAFHSSSNLSSIQIPKDVEKLGSFCFRDCYSLCEVSFDSSSRLRDIESYAFSRSGLRSIRVPNGVEKLGNYCFSGCESLYEVVFELESKLREIGNGAFMSHVPMFRSGLKSIRIPKCCAKVGSQCFWTCKKLCDVVFEPGCKLKEIGKETFAECASLKLIYVPFNVEKLCDFCFKECCSLSKVMFESGSKLKEIGKEAFAKCSSIQSIEIPSGVGKICIDAFIDCPLKCVRVIQGFSVDYQWPKGCRIEYVGAVDEGWCHVGCKVVSLSAVCAPKRGLIHRPKRVLKSPRKLQEGRRH